MHDFDNTFLENNCCSFSFSVRQTGIVNQCDGSAIAIGMARAQQLKLSVFLKNCEMRAHYLKLTENFFAAVKKVGVCMNGSCHIAISVSV